MTKTKQQLFTDRLFENVKPIWTKIHAHPFVRGIGSGTLDKETFAYYMKQDYVFLIDYAKLFAIGSMKAEDLETMGKFAGLLHETLHTEMDLHRQYAAEFGISHVDLEQTEATPVNLAYTRYMLNVAHNGGLAELISCLLPCMWSYWEIGKDLKQQNGNMLSANPYASWIEMYASAEFGALSEWLIELLNNLTNGKTERELSILEKHFITTSRYEYLFWDMVYGKHEWPI
ncbi:thiaminase II [Fictibacillus gelatini]|uniref:thiaminase II n=1 Tax=Fictibacillus gelatini TaxID=225985 RepID=UPI000406219B|nr:thiaminase II [Fictibacillus gelatini]